jgi:hypothetical protein
MDVFSRIISIIRNRKVYNNINEDIFNDNYKAKIDFISSIKPKYDIGFTVSNIVVNSEALVSNIGINQEGYKPSYHYHCVKIDSLVNVVLEEFIIDILVNYYKNK